MLKVELTRQEIEALIDLLELEERPWPIDGLAAELRDLCGMVTREEGEAAAAVTSPVRQVSLEINTYEVPY